MPAPDTSPTPAATDDVQASPARTLGRRALDIAERRRIRGLGGGPTEEEIRWIRSMSQYRTRVPKGVFRYRSHDEANADWERWHAELVAEVARRRNGPAGH